MAWTPRALLALLPLASANILWEDVCTQADVKSSVWCDTTKPHKVRAEAFVAALQPSEKVPIMTNEAQGVKRLHIPPYQWGSEGLHGPLEPCVCGPSAAAGGKTKCACPTSFPAPSAMGSAFNTSLYWLVGHHDGIEARAINNLRNHATQNNYGDGIDYWSPTLNMQRDPRWGRNQEVPGEDPMLTGQYAANFVQGLQGLEGGFVPGRLQSDDGPIDKKDGHLMISACCKHFLANSLESWEGHTRHNFDAQVPLNDLADYYLPSFKSCVMEGKSRGVMCSYNAVNGVPMCANPKYLNDTLRNSWKFEGYVTSDCDAVGDVSGSHHYTNAVNGSAISLKAGTDMDCGDWGAHAYLEELPAALKAGLVEETDLDRALVRLTLLQMDLGLFDAKGSQKFFQNGIDLVASDEHKRHALEAAQQSIVLLKNKGGLLPLKKGSKIAVLGPHTSGGEVFLSNYHGSGCLNASGGIGGRATFGCIESPLQAITAANVGGSTVGSAVLDSVKAALNPADKSAAVAMAKAAEVVLLVMGIDGSVEGEGHDRTNTTLPGGQPELISAVLEANPNTVLLLVHGGAMTLGSIKDAAPAIVDCFYGGEMAGQAMADVLFGDYNPSGKLTATMYPDEFVHQIPLTQMSVTEAPGRTHMYYDNSLGEPEFEFGDGLSYDTWSLEWHQGMGAESSTRAMAMTTDAESVLNFTVAVRNTGTRGGAQTVLGFWRPRAATAAALLLPLNGPGATPRSATTTGGNSSLVALRQKLFAFAGAPFVAAGASTRLEFSLTAEHLAVADVNGDQIVRPGEYDVFFRASTDTELLQTRLTVTGDARVVAAFAF